MYFGTKNDQATSFRLLDQYLDSGGTFIDTANIYASWVPGFKGGESETVLGHWMQARKNRGRLFIATKVGFQYGEVERGLRAPQIEAEVDKSLRRMGIETIDLYYAHKDDLHTPQEETLAAFDRLVRDGKVRFIGASNFPAWRLEEARWLSQVNGWISYCCIQQRYTYLRPKPGASFAPQLAVNEDLRDYCRSRRLTLLAYSALLSGAYSRVDRPIPVEYAGPHSDARLALLRAIAAEKGATVNQIILAWMLHSDPVVLPLIAASAEIQMAENIGTLEVALSPEDIQRLNTAGD
jgi:aryl-alcohol dehydrogenase-like predicted oxidoreductase